MGKHKKKYRVYDKGLYQVMSTYDIKKAKRFASRTNARALYEEKKNTKAMAKRGVGTFSGWHITRPIKFKKKIKI
jgi:hypothetical protein